MNLTPLVSRFSIIDKAAQQTPLVPNWAQQRFLDEVHRQYNARRPVRIITLKARQIGISTITEAVIFAFSQLFENYRGLIVAHESGASQNLLQMTKTYWETYPFRALLTEKYKSRNELAWVENRSSIHVATAKNVHTARSLTVHALHASEAAFWDNAATLMLGLRQTIPNLPGSIIVIESTANGIGNWFEKQWKAAESGDSEYTPLFFPWHEHPEYNAEYANVPIPSPFRFRDAEERILHRLGVDDSRLTWRRWAIRNLAGNDLLKFHQEYPSTPREAFVSTGTNVFPAPHLGVCYEPMAGLQGRLVDDAHESNGVRFQPDITGPLTLFRKPSSRSNWGEYYVGGDPTHSTRGDFAVAQVINRRSLEQVARWRGRIDPARFGLELNRLAKFYNNATVSSEIEGPGYATIGALIASGYPRIYKRQWAEKLPGAGLTGRMTDVHGWSTTTRTKHWAIGHLLKLVVDHDVVIHDAGTYDEMTDYVTKDNGEMGNASEDGFDDCVMALAIALICHHTDSPVAPFSDAPSDSVREAIDMIQGTSTSTHEDWFHAAV